MFSWILNKDTVCNLWWWYTYFSLFCPHRRIYIFLVTGDICYETVVYFLLLYWLYAFSCDKLIHCLIVSSISSHLLHFLHSSIHPSILYNNLSISSFLPNFHHHQQPNLLLSVAWQSELETSLPFLLMIIFFLSTRRRLSFLLLFFFNCVLLLWASEKWVLSLFHSRALSLKPLFLSN